CIECRARGGPWVAVTEGARAVRSCDSGAAVETCAVLSRRLHRRRSARAGGYGGPSGVGSPVAAPPEQVVPDARPWRTAPPSVACWPEGEPRRRTTPPARPRPRRWSARAPAAAPGRYV